MLSGKSIKIYIVLTVILLVFFFIYMKSQNKEIKTVCINGSCFDVELAETREQRIKGLMHREALAENSGMLFIYNEEDYYSFWMKNMKFPIDIIWMDRNKEVVHMEKDVPPCQNDECPNYKPSQKAMHILEIGSGVADKLNIKIGDKASFE